MAMYVVLLRARKKDQNGEQCVFTADEHERNNFVKPLSYYFKNGFQTADGYIRTMFTKHAVTRYQKKADPTPMKVYAICTYSTVFPS